MGSEQFIYSYHAAPRSPAFLLGVLREPFGRLPTNYHLVKGALRGLGEGPVASKHPMASKQGMQADVGQALAHALEGFCPTALTLDTSKGLLAKDKGGKVNI